MTDHIITAGEGDNVLGGIPLAPPMLGLPLFGQDDFPVAHVATAFVVASLEYRCVVLALARPDMQPGAYLGLTAEYAREVAGWLLRSANDLDGGSGRQ